MHWTISRVFFVSENETLFATGVRGAVPPSQKRRYHKITARRDKKLEVKFFSRGKIERLFEKQNSFRIVDHP